MFQNVTEKRRIFSCGDIFEFCNNCQKKELKYDCSSCTKNFVCQCEATLQPLCFGKCKLYCRVTMAEAGRVYFQNRYCNQCAHDCQTKHGFNCLKKKRKASLIVRIYRQIICPKITKKFVDGRWQAEIDHPLFENFCLTAADRQQLMKEVVRKIFTVLQCSLGGYYLEKSINLRKDLWGKEPNTIFKMIFEEKK